MKIQIAATLVTATLSSRAGLIQGHEMDGARHSAAWKDIVIHPTNDITEETADTPKEGPFIKYFSGTNAMEALNYAQQHDVKLPFVITNPSTQPLCILAGASNVGNHPHPTSVRFERDGTNGMLYLPANTTVQIGNFLPAGAGDQNYWNGRMQPLFGCDDKCENCAGYGNKTGSDGKEESSMFSNLSNVDGYSANVNVTVFNSAMGECNFRSCNATLKAVEKACPSDRLWKEGNITGCKSDCKHTGSEQHCCVGEYIERFGPKKCEPSSAFLADLCGDAYSWPYGDSGHIDYCSAPKAMHVVFYPIM